MDVVRLGERYTTAYVPDKLIEGYSSMIFTERWQTPGDFELKTKLVEETIDLLPEDTLISHQDTDVVMMVETHSIGEDDEGNAELTVTGRSLDHFFEHRFVEAPYRKKRRPARNYSGVGMMSVLMWNAVDNNSGKDVTRDGDYAWTVLDRIPNVSVSDSVINRGTARRWWLTEGQLYPQLEAIMIKMDLAIRTIRPSDRSNGELVTVTVNPLADRGTSVRTYTTNVGSLRFDIYDGIDRSHLQSANDLVAFNRLHGDIHKATYLYSSKDYKTALEIMSGVGGADVYRNNTQKQFSGIQRRVMSHDFGEPDIPPEPEKPEELRKNATRSEREARRDAMDQWLDDHAAWKNKKNQIISEFNADNAEDALRELKKARRVSMFNGDISPIAPYQFKKDYNLGDTVTLYGDYEEVETMVVSEYILTENDTGENGYPGLTTP